MGLSGVLKLSLFDDGLQPERTFLAWKRTMLLLAVASAAGARFTFETNGWAALIVGVAGLAAAASSYLLANRRYLKLNRSLFRSNNVETGGAMFVLAAVSTLLLSFLAMGYLIF